MIRYVPSLAAEEMSNALWLLQRPNRQPGDTRCLFSWVEDNNGQGYLVVDTTCMLRIHQSASFAPVAARLEPYVSNGVLTSENLADLEAVVDANRGGSINVYESFPQPFKDASRTYDQLVTEGKFDATTFSLRLIR